MLRFLNVQALINFFSVTNSRFPGEHTLLHDGDLMQVGRMSGVHNSIKRR